MEIKNGEDTRTERRTWAADGITKSYAEHSKAVYRTGKEEKTKKICTYKEKSVPLQAFSYIEEKLRLNHAKIRNNADKKRDRTPVKRIIN